ncbi:retron system putative HNH endonuclease [Pseudomonas paraglycinae]|uniref:retron system putative HNH endonuclease n=1 Tax=Pseudomonas paraglycinae TaxID=2892330 RepID=UPI001F38FC76|nr:retron system putative HNH endonuclease [Pseudomonas paraglycinae]
MRKIIKGAEPKQLTQWKRANTTLRYRDLPAEERQSVRSSCIEEQYGLCAYCCQSIVVDDAHNEHIEAQDRTPKRTLDFTNIVASCQRPNQCGHGRKTQPIDLTPLMAECESELKFYLSGRVAGQTERAKESIKTLNLGHTDESNRGLIGARKKLVDDLIFTGGMSPDELEDEELLGILLDDLLKPKEGRLQPFSPVLVNVIRHYLAQP